MIRFNTDVREVSRILHRKRLRIDPQYRGELVRLFENPRARMAYFSKRGLTIDAMCEALWDAGCTFERCTSDDLLEYLEQLFSAAGTVRERVSRSEVRDTLAEVQTNLERELAVRRKNRWRVFRCACSNSRPVRVAADELPPCLARATCEHCGEPYALQTIKLDLSNRSVPMSADELTEF